MVKNPHEVLKRIDARGLAPPDLADVLACWPLAEEDGDTVADVAPQHRDGRIVNHATWMIGGPSLPGEPPGRVEALHVARSPQSRGAVETSSTTVSA